MRYRLVVLVLTIALLTDPESIAAQTISTEVTVKVPVNLTQLGPDVAKVQVGCSLSGPAVVTASDKSVRLQEVPATGGQVVTTVSLVFSLTGLDNPVGTSATLSCGIDGFSTLQQSWYYFADNALNLSFRTTPSLGYQKIDFIW